MANWPWLKLMIYLFSYPPHDESLCFGFLAWEITFTLRLHLQIFIYTTARNAVLPHIIPLQGRQRCHILYYCKGRQHCHILYHCREGSVAKYYTTAREGSIATYYKTAAQAALPHIIKLQLRQRCHILYYCKGRQRCHI